MLMPAITINVDKYLDSRSITKPFEKKSHFATMVHMSKTCLRQTWWQKWHRGARMKMLSTSASYNFLLKRCDQILRYENFILSFSRWWKWLYQCQISLTLDRRQQLNVQSLSARIPKASVGTGYVWKHFQKLK